MVVARLTGTAATGTSRPRGRAEATKRRAEDIRWTWRAITYLVEHLSSKEATLATKASAAKMPPSRWSLARRVDGDALLTKVLRASE